MELKDIQKKVDDSIKDLGGYWKPLEMFTAMVEEVGEVGRELNAIHGPKKKTKDTKGLERELGDLLYSMICLANDEKIDLDKAVSESIDKSLNRDKKRFT